MTNLMVFDTPHGPVAVEIDDAAARAAGARPQGGMVAKGGAPAETVAKAPGSFSDALGVLRACAGGVTEVLSQLAVAPSEVEVQVGLKLTGSAGFVITRAGAETELAVKLTWKPAARPAA